MTDPNQTAGRHPARTIPFDDLLAGLETARTSGFVLHRQDRETGRVLYCYTSRCVYEQAWDNFTTIARGLILHPTERRLIATPFPKFFNAGEGENQIPDLPFETYEKLDGSLAIIHHHDGRWRAATKGAFDSAQALWTEARLGSQDLSVLEPGTTYLAEAIYPENRIVIRYSDPALVLLGAYRADGRELDFDALADVAARLGWRTPVRHRYASVAQLIADAQGLPATAEGFVLRFDNGLRLKVKGGEYRRIHALISRCTPLAMWEAMAAGDDMAAIRRDLPEEFWADFDEILRLLSEARDALLGRIVAAAEAAATLSDKELGLSLAGFPEDTRPFLFPYRKAGNRLAAKSVEVLYRAIRPTGNVLDGYVASYAMGRMMDEAG